VRGLLKPFAVVAAAVVAATAGFALAATVSVTLGPKGPQPAVVSVEWGDTLQFVNGDSVTHAITSPHDDIGPATLAPGATVGGTVTLHAGSYQFRQTGGKNFVGTVVVTATGTVTLKASRRTVVYGQAVTLSGVTSKADTPVLIEQRTVGATAWSTVTTVSSAADGTFGDVVKPELSTRLRASVAGGQIRSAPVAVALAPALSISSTARATRVGRTIPISARLSPASAATRITLSECSPYTQGWRTVATRPPGLGGRVTFRWTAGYGRTLLRAGIGRRDAAPGFLTQQSATIAVIAAGSPPNGKVRPSRGC
jgi:plastocyanin